MRLWRAFLATATVLASGAPAAMAQSSVTPMPARATRFADKPAIAFGTAWYPEQWPESRWDADLAWMKEAGFNTVRIAEFAWSTMEPREGEFHFEWLDRAIAAARRHGIMVVLGTPTAAPPAWLTQKYPDVLRVDEDGTRATHGGRRQFSFASQRYRDFARRIATKMAQRYGNNPDIVGWQIDNEIGPPSFGKEAISRWHAFLKERYGSIDNLNQRWATEYWSQHYNDFDQIPLHATGQQNPALLLDFKHFTTATWTDYVMNQASAIRAHADPRQFITTNTMFWNGGFDHFKLHRGLDLAAWDNYIQDADPDWVANGADHDLVRGYKQRNFWLMETQAGRVDWVPVNRALKPGQVREMGWQAIAHGADAILYWELRPARNGQETYYGTVLGQDGTPAPIFDEIAKLGSEIRKASDALADTNPVYRMAMLFSYDSRWAIDLQRLHKDFDPIDEFTDFYRPFRNGSQGVAVLSPSADLSAYPLVVAPALNVMTQEEADHLSAYVRAGGNLVLGPRSGMKDDADALWPERQPGPLQPLLGARVEQFYALDEPVQLAGDFGEGEASIWAEWLKPQSKDVRIRARYADPGGWLDGKPAIVSRKVGKGSITYIGAWLEPAAMRDVAQQLMDDAGVRPMIPNVPEGVEIGERSGAGKHILIAINHGDSPKPVAIPANALPVAGEVANDMLRGHGVAVFRVPAGN
ncbi:beta-galactosidase [Stakelama sp. CBK3Z-3]|uniref:Beta-galactosidase n=2 Tax=Stakelama flava TaxID=2860338 RepID=A0ABS6XQU5_9SPHN|nr:beta-galactosidase [Stakelama flava]